jgi:hypothetical protein
LAFQLWLLAFKFKIKSHLAIWVVDISIHAVALGGPSFFIFRSVLPDNWIFLQLLRHLAIFIFSLYCTSTTASTSLTGHITVFTAFTTTHNMRGATRLLYAAVFALGSLANADADSHDSGALDTMKCAVNSPQIPTPRGLSD